MFWEFGLENRGASLGFLLPPKKHKTLAVLRISRPRVFIFQNLRFCRFFDDLRQFLLHIIGRFICLENFGRYCGFRRGFFLLLRCRKFGGLHFFVLRSFAFGLGLDLFEHGSEESVGTVELGQHHEEVSESLSLVGRDFDSLLA